MSVKSIPEGYHSVTPYLTMTGAAKAIAFYQQAFGASEIVQLATPEGVVMHAEIKIGDSTIMLADSCEDTGFRDPKMLGGSSVGLYVYVDNVDELFSQAVEAGAKIVSPVEDQFYGDRSGTLEDPFGHFWFISTHIEDLSPEEISERAMALYAQGSK